MTGSILSSAALDARRRRTLFRAWRRGLRELDLIFGAYADAHLPDITDVELDEFETLLEIPDPQMLAWITGDEAPPAERDTVMLGELRRKR